jgi:hypothetical protein
MLLLAMLQLYVDKKILPDRAMRCGREGEMALGRRDRLILAGADPRSQSGTEGGRTHDSEGATAFGIPAVMHGQWALGGASSGAFCDGVCLISRVQKDAVTPEAEGGEQGARETAAGGENGCEGENEEKESDLHLAQADKATLAVLSGPWYLDHVSVWAHGCTSLLVSGAGMVLGRMSAFGGEVSICIVNILDRLQVFFCKFLRLTHRIE